MPTIEKLSPELYEDKRLELGLPDASRDISVDKNFILEVNIKELNGVNFDKGCYVGQELTARMNHRTTVKKRLLPIVAREGILMSGMTIINNQGKNIGDIRSTNGQRAIAYIKLEYLGEDNIFFADGRELEVIIPDWLDISA